MSMSKTKYINKRSKQINIQHRHTFHTCLGVRTYYAVWHMKNTTKEYNMSSESVLKWRIYLNIMHICVYVVQGVFSYPSHKTNSQDRQEELCQSMLLSWRSSLCMRTHVHSVTLSCARIIYYPCPPPFAKGISYQRPNKLSEMNHYIPKYRLRSDLRK
jgi:hypothetical protein